MVHCDNGNPTCTGFPNNIVCGTGSNTTCCQPNTTCSPDGTCGEGCKDPQICNNSQGNQCCNSLKKCLCVKGKEDIGQCKFPDTIDNNTCCSPENTIMHDKSVNGINECCPYQAAKCTDGTNCTGINVDSDGKWHCCPGDFNGSKCAVACGGEDGKKTFCKDTEYCMAITDAKGNTKYSCANNTCTWDSEITYPQIQNDAYAYTTDCMNPAAFVENLTIDSPSESPGISDRQKYVCNKTWENLPQIGKDRYFSEQLDPSKYDSTLRFFRAKSTMDSSGLPLCNANDCIKKLSNYGDVAYKYNEKTGECWGNQTMTSYCDSEKENQTILAAADPVSCLNLTHVTGFLNYVDANTDAGMCPITPENGGCADFDPAVQYF